MTLTYEENKKVCEVLNEITEKVIDKALKELRV